MRLQTRETPRYEGLFLEPAITPYEPDDDDEELEDAVQGDAIITP
ncbi:hypothetical protein [Streptomyces sp. NPDC088348]